MDGPRVFMSYRREDALGFSRLIYSEIVARFGEKSVFRDLDRIAAGEDYVRGVSDAINRSNVALVLVGLAFATIAGSDGKPRLNDPDDLLAHEIVSSIQRGLKVIPVLLDGAHMPKDTELPLPLRDFAHLNAVELRDARWREDMDHLLGVIGSVAGGVALPPLREEPKEWLSPDSWQTNAHRTFAPTEPAPAPVSPPPISRRPIGAMFAAVGAVVVVGAALAVLLVTRTPTATHVVTQPTTTEAATAPRTSTTKTVASTVDPARQAYLAYTQKIENILQHSANGRGQVGPLVGAVAGCSLTPDEAALRMQTVVANRTSVLDQLASIASPPDDAARAFTSLLQQALQSSITADAHYKNWMEYLASYYSYTSPPGCPNGHPPENDAFLSARQADAHSTALKTQFVAAFTPVAKGLGLPTWQATDF